ncbi:MAG TPA: macro domain-containing protein [Chitinophagaceae bacterium]|nr:macro domain-containing protein [Chitinophagaceae bacterium]HPH30480.1 macro domain-containing protein [Chitinophagaceae bacterium]HPN57663.1 macro domain-containing protein [Chitinophagaceae bacterium]
MTNEVHYTKGDATQPTGTGNKVIVHICNDIGGWGRGFVMAISSRWKKPENEYRNWFNSAVNFSLGEVQFVQVEVETWVANLIGQHGIKRNNQNIPPIRYKAVADGLRKVADFCKPLNASVHMPKIGCGLAGGTWDEVEPIIISAFIPYGIPVTVYNFD